MLEEHSVNNWYIEAVPEFMENLDEVKVCELRSFEWSANYGGRLRYRILDLGGVHYDGI